MARRGALRREIGRVLRGRSDPEQTAIEVLGPELGARVTSWFRRARIRDASREGIEWVDVERDNRDPVVRTGLALVLIVAERMSTKYGRATGKALYRGRRHRETDDGLTEYVPAASAGGMAARLDLSPREIERYLAVVSACGLWSIHQRPPTEAETQKGQQWGYAVYQWVGSLPRQLMQRLRAYYGGSKAPPGTTERQPTSEAGQRLAELLLRAHAPPS